MASPLSISLSCGSARLSSSRTLGWKGLLVERHIAHARPADQSTFSTCLIELASGRSNAYGERAVSPGEFRHYSKLPGMLNLYTEGVRPALRPTTTTELTVCAIDSAALEQVRLEAGLKAGSRPIQAFGFRDSSVEHLLSALEIEAREGNPSGRLYADHLIQALLLRLYTVSGTPEQPAATRWDLPKRRLRRVIELLQSNPRANHDLETLAHESGYSRSHFIKAFQAATGKTPHAFLLDLRVERAAAMLRDRSLRIIDVAEACGFGSQAHFSRVFRRLRGLTPGEHRGNRSF